jgi:hypothetical protein
MTYSRVRFKHFLACIGVLSLLFAMWARSMELSGIAANHRDLRLKGATPTVGVVNGRGTVGAGLRLMAQG